MALAYPGGATGHDEGAAPGLEVWLCRIGRVLAVTAGSLLLIVQLQVTDRRGDPVDCAYADCRPAVRLPPALFLVLSTALACDILAFCQTLALARTPARKWEPRTLRLLSIPAVIARHARRTVLRYKTHHTGNDATPAPPNHPVKDQGQCHEAGTKQQVARPPDCYRQVRQAPRHHRAPSCAGSRPRRQAATDDHVG